MSPHNIFMKTIWLSMPPGEAGWHEERHICSSGEDSDVFQALQQNNAATSGVYKDKLYGFLHWIWINETSL